MSTASRVYLSILLLLVSGLCVYAFVYALSKSAPNWGALALAATALTKAWAIVKELNTRD